LLLVSEEAEVVNRPGWLKWTAVGGGEVYRDCREVVVGAVKAGVVKRLREEGGGFMARLEEAAEDWLLLMIREEIEVALEGMTKDCWWSCCWEGEDEARKKEGRKDVCDELGRYEDHVQHRFVDQGGG
jgi:hypothetical protein